MPIRTNRGRAAVYRKVWGWPLRSPRHLVGVLLVVAAVAVAVGITIVRSQGESGSGDEQQRAGLPSAPSVTVTEPSQASALPNRVTTLPKPSSAPPAPEALTAAERWTEAWAHHPRGVSNKQWRDALRPYTTPEFLPELRSVDPANVPANKVTGKPKPVDSYQSSLTARVPTDGGAVQVTVVKTGQGWRVSTYGKG